VVAGDRGTEDQERAGQVQAPRKSANYLMKIRGFTDSLWKPGPIIISLTKLLPHSDNRQGSIMDRSAGRREVVAACMESPLYFTLPLQERLALMKQVEQQLVLSTLRQAFLGWIKTGILISSE
jgi:hypothetical protein